jgi:hypothetical protein
VQRVAVMCGERCSSPESAAATAVYMGSTDPKVIRS